MAFPTSNTTQDIANVFGAAQTVAESVKLAAQALSADAAAGPVHGQRIVNFASTMRASRIRLLAARDTPGIGAYATGLGIVDVAAEFNAMMAAIDGTLAWIAANIPTSPGGFLEVATLAADGQLTWRTFAPAATAAFRITLDALVATID